MLPVRAYAKKSIEPKWQIPISKENRYIHLVEYTFLEYLLEVIYVQYDISTHINADKNI